ncbi:MAG: YitT family protein [Firmicutes bacterium]|nr:YitT family protein [Bacillota bacterium]
MKQQLKDLAMIIIGVIITAVGINSFIIPYKILAGGVTGLAILGQYITGVETYIILFVINIPIFLLGAKEINKRFIIFSFIATAGLSLSLPLLEGITINTQDILLASIFGGIIIGIGNGLIFRAGSSFGGTDIIAVIFKKKLDLNVGEFLLLSNVVIVVGSLIVNSAELAMYTIVCMAVSSKIIDIVQYGFNTKKTAMIVSGRPEELAQSIVNEFGRGATLLSGQGAYSLTEKKVINCVVNRFELPRLKNLVREIDPEAFMTITATNEVLGGGFAGNREYEWYSKG